MSSSLLGPEPCGGRCLDGASPVCPEIPTQKTGTCLALDTYLLCSGVRVQLLLSNQFVSWSGDTEAGWPLLLESSSCEKPEVWHWNSAAHQL